MSNSSSNISTIQNKLATLFSRLESMTKSNDHMRIATLAELDKLLSELMEAFLEAFFKPLSAGLHSKSSDKTNVQSPNETLQVSGVDNKNTKKLAHAMLEEILKLPVLGFENKNIKKLAHAMLEERFKLWHSRLSVLGVDNESTKKLARAMLEEIFKSHSPVSHSKSSDKTNKIQVSQLQRPRSASSLSTNVSITSHSKELKIKPSMIDRYNINKSKGGFNIV